MFGFCFVCKCVCVCNGVNYSTRLIYRAVKLIRWNMALVVLTSLTSPLVPPSSPLRCPPFFLFLALPTFVSRASNALIPAYHKQSQHRIHRSLHAAERSICEYLELNGMEQTHFRIIVYTRYVCVRYYSAPWIIRNVYNIIPVGVYFVLSNCALWTNERCFLEGKSVRLFCAAAISSFEFPLFR